MSSPPSDPLSEPERFRAWHLVVPALLVLMAAAARVWLTQSLDLRDLPGAGGVKIITALATGHFSRDWATWLLASALPLFDGDVELTSRAGMILGGTAAAAGAALCAAAIAGRRAASGAIIVAALWSQSLFVSILIGADALALGTAWLGVGLCWIAARLSWWGLPLAFLGVLIGAFGVAIKVVAVPAVVFVTVAPFLVGRRKWPVGIGITAVMGAAAWIARVTYLPTETGHVDAAPTVNIGVLQSGIQRMTEMPDVHPEGTILLQLAGLAIVGALIPGRGWLLRVGLGAAAAGALAFAAESIGVKLRPRHFVTPALPLIVLCGAATGLAQDWLWRGAKRILPPRVRPVAHVGWIFPLTLGALLAIDSTSFFGAWARLRTTMADAEPATLPIAPPAWQHRYAQLRGLVFFDTSDPGAVTAVEMARNAPAGGVASPPLRDAREFHVSAGAALGGRPYRVLEARHCCATDEDLSTCAMRVATALDAAGARLLLPREDGRTHRVPQEHARFASALNRAAASLNDAQTPSDWWLAWDGRGEGGPLPCKAPRNR